MDTIELPEKREREIPRALRRLRAENRKRSGLANYTRGCFFGFDRKKTAHAEDSDERRNELSARAAFFRVFSVVVWGFKLD